mmetsp:Transcript_21031/g.47376  ORF Transcript_21031/g.47376 Transcript_21031/m.47376 type:complete len:236 (-) Transcript_21031:504-1211(-)
MPTPTCASMIMGTSLAPSPMARERGPPSSRLITVTTCRFWSGDTRHAMTALHLLATCTKRRSSASSSVPPPSSSWSAAAKMWRREPPSMMRARSLSSSASSSVPHSWLNFLSSSLARGRVSTAIRWMDMLSWRRLQAKPMFSAVSILSPVSIQILILASLSRLIAAGTPSCSLSSIAVTPTNRIPCSITSAARASSSSRSTSAVAAALCVSFHLLHCSSVSLLFASTSVLSPSIA